MSTQSNKNVDIKSFIEHNNLINLKEPPIIPIEPPFKWIGGKRRLVKEIINLFPNSYTTLYELFFGAGALTFHLHPENVVINDFSSELINFYNIVKNNVDDMIEILKTYQVSVEFFYHLRNLDRNKEIFEKLTNIERASRFFYYEVTSSAYIVRYCYNARVNNNRRGELMSTQGQEI